MDEKEGLMFIEEEGVDAYDLLYNADLKLISRFTRACTTLKKILDDTQAHFPDAKYYTASGGFHLMLGNPHNEFGHAQQKLIAVGASNGLMISDGDF
jgi:hypothetical protein